MHYGCSNDYIIYGPCDFQVESIKGMDTPNYDNLLDSGGHWFYAKDTVLVKNVDLSEINYLNVSQRVFSSRDIKKIRATLNLPNQFFLISKAHFIELEVKNKRFDFENVFKIFPENHERLFYIEIPYKKVKKTNDVYYIKVYPVTYINDTLFIIHGRDKVSDSSYKKIYDSLLKDIDSVSVNNWIKMCKQGVTTSIYYIHKCYR